MKTELKAKLIQHLLAKKSSEKGFTLIELLVVIFIIGFLAANALPAFLNQANRASLSEATTYVGSINRAQQAYRLEERTFSNQIGLLGLGVNTSTTFYTYGDANGVENTLTNLGAADFSEGALIYATPLDVALLGYCGSTYLLQTVNGDATTSAVLCKSSSPNAIPTITATGTLGSSTVTVGAGTSGECD